MLPAGTRIAVGMRPQWLTASPLLEQLLSLGGQMAGQSMDAVRREMAGVDMVIMASTRSGGSPLILARAADVVRATKAERDPYRYVDPDTILVGDWNETDAAMRRLFSQDPVSAEARMAGRVAAWSDVWLVMDPRITPRHGGTASGSDEDDRGHGDARRADDGGVAGYTERASRRRIWRRVCKRIRKGLRFSAK